MSPAPASAGAWVVSEGGQEIWGSAVGERDDLTFFESSAYLELPLNDDASFVATPWAEQNYDTADGWKAEATVGVKHAIFRDDEAAMAVQAGALWISHPSDPDCGEGGAEVRWLAGRALGERGFVNLEVATRALNGGCESERADLTLGYRPSAEWLGMAQIYLDAPREDEDVVRAQISLVRFWEGGNGVQFGLRTRIDGGPAEAAFVLNLWGRPGD
ncbi:MAG: hypothetical protein AB7O98_17400 [Hyphomonadaceae bacterium]